MNLCFDSNILIDAMNGRGEALAELQAADARIISIVVWVETLVGTRNEAEDERTRRLLRNFEVVPVTTEVAAVALEIRRSTRLKLPDAIVLATARVKGCQLSTRNTRDFRADFPDVRIPYQL